MKLESLKSTTSLTREPRIHRDPLRYPPPYYDGEMRKMLIKIEDIEIARLSGSVRHEAKQV